MIADSLGGPSGDTPDHSWNFVPLCSDCNRNHQKTKNLIDWLLEEGKRNGDNTQAYMPLYEVLIRLQRACEKNRHIPKGSARSLRSALATLAPDVHAVIIMPLQ